MSFPACASSERGPKAPPLLVCFSHLRWNFVHQRPQHLLSRAAVDHEVIFVEEPLFEGASKPVLKCTLERPGIKLAVPVLPVGMNGAEVQRSQRRLIDRLLHGYRGRRVLHWYYTPMALPFTRHLSADVCIYDNMDELSAFHGAPPRLMKLEQEMFRRADVVFTGGQSLFEAKRDRHHNIHPFPSSVDTDHFAKARRGGREDPPDQAEIPRPRLGFFGVIDERMDIGLVAALAEAKPKWQIIMIGPVVKVDPDSLPRRANIHWLGGKQYSELPNYLGGWDAGIMPFALNESTRFISPTKTPEFLAAGLPVVSTPITDVVKPYGRAGLVEIAATPGEFAGVAAMLLDRPRGPWISRVDRHLASMSWDATWAGMDAVIQGVMTRPRVAGSETEVGTAHV